MELPTPQNQNAEASKNQQLDAILGLNNQGEVQNNEQYNEQNNDQNVQEETKYDKAQKTLRNDFIVIFILELIVIGMTASEGNLDIFSVVFAALSLLEIYLASIKSKYSWILEIFFGIGMLSTIIIADIIDDLLGLFIIIHSIVCLIQSKKIKNKNKIKNIKKILIFFLHKKRTSMKFLNT